MSENDPAQHRWDGERITNKLRTWERDSFPDTWIICGKDGHLCGMGSHRRAEHAWDSTIEKLSVSDLLPHMLTLRSLFGAHSSDHRSNA